MSRFCYHYDLTDGRCTRCGTPVAILPGHTVRVSLFGAESEPYGVWVAGTESPTVAGALASLLGVPPSAIVLRDVSPDGDPWDRRLAVRFSLTGSRVDVVARVTITQAEHREPAHTEVDDEDRPVVPEPAEA